MRTNRLSGIVGKAASQLRSSSDQPHDFRILWLTAAGVDAEARYYQLIATLYGSTRIIELDNPTLRHCYFFRNSEFFRYADTLDGAVAAHATRNDLSARLCLNPYSPKWQDLKNSPLARHFGSAIEDPLSAEADSLAFVLDGDVDRADEQAILRFLQDKYSTKPLMNMDMNLASATVLVPR